MRLEESGDSAQLSCKVKEVGSVVMLDHSTRPWCQLC